MRRPLRVKSQHCPCLREALLAQPIQLGIEYDPAPPFTAGSHRVASPAVMEAAMALLQPQPRA